MNNIDSGFLQHCYYCLDSIYFLIFVTGLFHTFIFTNIYFSNSYLTSVDHMIIAVYSEQLYHNNRNKFNRGVAVNAMLQWWWGRIGSLPMSSYDATLGQVGCRFVKPLMEELKGLRTRYWKSKQPLCLRPSSYPQRITSMPLRKSPQK